MSTEQPLDPQLIEQTKQQIRSLVGEISQLTKTEISPEEFYSEFLTRVVSALAAVGGVVWTANQDGQLALQYQINLQETRLREQEEAQAQHGRLLYKVFSSGEGMLAPPHSGAEDGQQAGNPTDFLLVFGLLKTDLETVGVVEIFQRSDAAASAQKGYLRFLGQMCELAADFLKSHQLRHFSDRQSLWTQLEDFTRMVYASLDPRETAYTIANEGRRLIECDRLSVAIRKGKRCKIEAISGQDVFDKRSNVVRLLGRLATAVTASGDAVWYTGDTQDLAPQVEKAVEEYVDEAHSKTVAILPLKRPGPPEEEDPAKRTKPAEPIGALIVEQIEDSRVPASMIQRVEVVSRHSSTALANAMEHQNLFLMPLWRTLGKTRWVLQARTLPKTLSISAAVLAVILFLALWPAKFEMESKGTLEPVDRRDVFVNTENSVVDDLKVDHGDQVQADQLLAQLRSTKLENETAIVQGELASTKKAIASRQRDLQEEGKLSPEVRSRLRGEKAELEAKRESLEIQLDLCKLNEKELSIKSPLSGQVVTWDLRNRLPPGRPVQRGQVLMRVADPSGPWQLELHMPENRMGHVAEQQKELYAKARDKLRNLLKEQLLAKLPKTPSEQNNNTAPNTPAEENNKTSEKEQSPAIPPQAAGEQTDKPAESQQSPPKTPENAADKPTESGQPILQSPQAAGETSDKPLETQQPAGKTPQSPEEEINRTVEEELAKIPNAELYAKQISVLNEILHDRLEEIVKSLPDGESKDKLAEILKEESYDKAREKIKAFAAEAADAELSARLAALAAREPEDDRLRVSYILATEPGTYRTGTVAEIETSAEVRGDEGVTVLIKVAISKEDYKVMVDDKATYPNLRPGATVTAKVYCGRRSLGYVLLDDLISFIQTRIIFRYF
ncbi:MAG: HlyD family efflux transporter periplasmic adaptor subunit [Thermoguttaceae bacterium]